METLFNFDQDGSPVISERGSDPDQLPAEIRIPARELPALRAILNAPALAHCNSTTRAAFFNDLCMEIDDEDGSIILEQTMLNGMRGTDSRIEITQPQLLPAISELARLAQLVGAIGSLGGGEPQTN